jgi:RNA polymerase-associated protein CTR9
VQLQYALEKFRYVLEKDPGNLLAAHGAACCLGVAGDSMNAQRCLMLVQEQIPNAKYVVEGLPIHLANLKLRGEAFKQSIDIYKNIPDDERDYSIYSSLAICLACDGCYEEASQTVEAALVKYPEHPVLTYNAAVIHCAHAMRLLHSAHSLTEAEGGFILEVIRNGVIRAQSFITTPVSPKSMQNVDAARRFIAWIARFTSDLREDVNRLVIIGRAEQWRMEKLREQWREKYAEALRKELLEEENALALKRGHLMSLNQLAEERWRKSFAVVPTEPYDYNAAAERRRGRDDTDGQGTGIEFDDLIDGETTAQPQDELRMVEAAVLSGIGLVSGSI